MDMGKAIILKKKDGEKVYPISASDLIFNPETKRTVKDDLEGKIGDAPSDGKQYVRKNGAWGELDVKGGVSYVQINILSNQGIDESINDISASLKYDDVVLKVKNNDIVVVPKNTSITITFPEVEGYRKPADISYEQTEDYVIKEGLYCTERVIVSLSANDGTDVSGHIININGIEYTYENKSIELKIPFDTEYSISVSDIIGYASPLNQTFIASENVRELNLVYQKIIMTTVRINQTISDPSQMITAIINNGGIEAIRANSHRYTGELVDDIMNLKQLKDDDGTKYLDGTNAPLTTNGIDVWMKLPKFYWKCEEYSTDIWDFTVVYGVKPDDTFKEWDDRELIGVYELFYDYDSSKGVYSIARDSNAQTNYSNLITKAGERGENYSLLKWKHFCMIVMLYYAYYRNTYNPLILGSGSEYSVSNAGSSNELGMEDSAYPSEVNNFWGLENIACHSSEFLQNVTVNNNQFIITEDDGTQRVFEIPSTNGYVSKMLFGDNIDLIPKELNASSTTGFCSGFSSNSYDDRCVSAGGQGVNGILCSFAILKKTSTFNGLTSRLCYKGEYTLIN